MGCSKNDREWKHCSTKYEELTDNLFVAKFCFKYNEGQKNIIYLVICFVILTGNSNLFESLCFTSLVAFSTKQWTNTLTLASSTIICRQGCETFEMLIFEFAKELWFHAVARICKNKYYPNKPPTINHLKANIDTYIM